MSKEDAIDQELSHEVEARESESTSLEELLERHRPLLVEEEARRADGPLLGEVLEVRSLDFPGRVLVRWLDELDRPQERWLLRLRGFRLCAGDQVLLSKPDNWGGWVVTGAIERGVPEEEVRELDVEAAKEALDLRVDGRRVELEGHDEVVLRCGLSSITLRRNGRVVIQGTQIETSARGANRIKGGSVEIN
jgi:hypothetical protein